MGGDPGMVPGSPNKKWSPGTPSLVQSIDGFQWRKAWRASQKEADLKSVKMEDFWSTKSMDLNGLWAQKGC